jgi:acylphosphatase
MSRHLAGFFYFTEMIISRVIRVKGKVQGVNFRYHTKQQALKLGISGTVANRDDGTVLIIAQGEEEPMDKFMKWCSMGPSRAVVIGLEVVETQSSVYEEFEIIY